MAGKTVANAVSNFGVSVKPKLANVAISGAPEDQLRGPLEALMQDLAELGGLSAGSARLIGETTLSDLKTRPAKAKPERQWIAAGTIARGARAAPLHRP